MINKILAKKINNIVECDKKIRLNADKAGLWNPIIYDSNKKTEDFKKIIINLINVIDRKNTAELKKIIKIYGWPTIPMVGKKASFNAWLLAQHSGQDIKFKKYVLKLLKKIYKKNNKDIVPSNIAFLTDRILVAEGKKQIFGTQFYINKKKLFVPRPIKNIKDIEKRRKEYGMRPFSEDLLSAKERFKK